MHDIGPFQLCLTHTPVRLPVAQTFCISPSSARLLILSSPVWAVMNVMYSEIIVSTLYKVLQDVLRDVMKKTYSATTHFE